MPPFTTGFSKVAFSSDFSIKTPYKLQFLACYTSHQFVTITCVLRLRFTATQRTPNVGIYIQVKWNSYLGSSVDACSRMFKYNFKVAHSLSPIQTQYSFWFPLCHKFPQPFPYTTRFTKTSSCLRMTAVYSMSDF